MGDISVNSQNTQTKSASAAATKGALIGAGIGAASQGVSDIFRLKAANKVLCNKDEFITKTINEKTKQAKKWGIELGDARIEGFREDALSAFETCKKATARLKKSMPKNILVKAGVFGALGAGIGLVARSVKKKKAEKENSITNETNAKLPDKFLSAQV